MYQYVQKYWESDRTNLKLWLSVAAGNGLHCWYDLSDVMLTIPSQVLAAWIMLGDLFISTLVIKYLIRLGRFENLGNPAFFEGWSSCSPSHWGSLRCPSSHMYLYMLHTHTHFSIVYANTHIYIYTYSIHIYIHIHTHTQSMITPPNKSFDPWNFRALFRILRQEIRISQLQRRPDWGVSLVTPPATAGNFMEIKSCDHIVNPPKDRISSNPFLKSWSVFKIVIQVLSGILIWTIDGSYIYTIMNPLFVVGG